MTQKASGYPPIGDLGLVGDGQSVALLGPDGHVEFFCPLRFDAPPLIWPLLDRQRGGDVHVGPADDVTTTITYLPDTAVLRYEYVGTSGRARSTIAMRWPADRGTQELLWLVEGLEGQLTFEVNVHPEPDFGRQDTQLTLDQHQITYTGDHPTVDLATGIPVSDMNGSASGSAVLREGQRWGFRLWVGEAGKAPSHVADAADVARELEQTAQAWRDWTAGITYNGTARENVIRSAITLKLLIFEETGAVTAAATTSLPERIGGERNWDYRYTWLRDASFTLNALYSLGCTDEARAYARWMCETTAAHGLPLRVLYGIDGSAKSPEEELTELDGYRGSRPVRVGNGAESQLQLDSYGELLGCLTICESVGDDVMRAEWPHFRRLVEFVADNWHRPDSGIWEVRSEARHFVHSKTMAWVALDRGCTLVERYGLHGDLDRWRREADTLRREILDRGVVHGRFRRAYDDDDLDASLLMLSITGFVAGDDPLMLATIDAIREQLHPPASAFQGLLLRYPEHAGDGLTGSEGAFLLCSFWLVEALALAGRADEAHKLFDELIEHAGRVGLFAEELDWTNGEQLGNTPQAFTHIGLINAALRLQTSSLRTASRTRASQNPASDSEAAGRARTEDREA
jgi:GH15 family glucan-1,4-alpha-glucosidase